MLAAPLKELQGNLRHLSWQTQQVAKGDFSQRVDFMGEFSQAFNTMTTQLAEKTESLMEEKKLVDAMNTELQKSLDLMLELADDTHSMIYVISCDDNRLIFQNRTAQWFEKIHPGETEKLWKSFSGRTFPENGRHDTWEIVLRPEGKNDDTYLRIETHPIQWSGTPALAHVITDITQQKQQESFFHSLAYADPLTGLHNRRYAMDRLEALSRGNAPFVLTMVDIDYLKYCNDTFGHEKGDEYLKAVAALMKTQYGGDVCRVGGDEFFIIKEDDRLQQHQDELANLRAMFMAEDRYPYPHSFSFASSLIDPHTAVPMEQHLQEIDRMMYEYKKTHKNFLADCQYRDDRMPG
ncbi:MAG: diguanylate cyclase [Clostridia bacterium]|nr:diguanylate cyclase [Clostridia bacterium]